MPAFVYDFGGLEVRSSCALPGLRLRAPGPEAVSIAVDVADGPAPEPRQELFRWPGLYGLALSALASGWLFSTREHGSASLSADGRALRCYPRGTADGWPDVVVRRVLPRVAQWHGRVALHAAAVVDGRSAIVLLGPSRAGKSTLAGALRDRGWRVLSDDISLFDVDGPGVRAFAASTGLCLWPDSLSAVASHAGAGRRVAGHAVKRWIDEDDAAPIPPCRVASLVLLEPRDDVEEAFHPVDAASAAMCAGQQMVVFDPNDADRLARAWAAIGRFAGAVPMIRCRYRRGYDRLDGLVEALTRRAGEQALVRA